MFLGVDRDKSERTGFFGSLGGTPRRFRSQNWDCPDKIGTVGKYADVGVGLAAAASLGFLFTQLPFLPGVHGVSLFTHTQWTVFTSGEKWRPRAPGGIK